MDSIECVASVDASGLVEESVHVIIRQDKIDAINEQVFGYIEGEFADAEKEIADGKKELADGQQELNDSIADLQENQADLDKNKKDLDEGLDEVRSGINALDSKKTETAKQLAEAQTLINEKKTEITKGLVQIESALTAAGYTEAVQKAPIYGILLEGLRDIDASADAASIRVAAQALAATEAGSIASTLLNGITDAASLNAAISEIEGKKATAEAIIESPQVEALLEQKAQLEAADTTLSQKLTEANMGEMLAAIEIGSGSATLNVTKSQLKSAKEQLDSAQEQLDSAWDQISDAQDQINDGWDSLRDGEKELNEQKQNALDSADMTNILTVDTVKSLLAAQNFSMPGGYVTEEGIDYLVRIGDKPEDVETLANMPLMNLDMDGVDTIYLKDVADVFMTDNSEESYTNINGKPGILLSIQKHTGNSTVELYF